MAATNYTPIQLYRSTTASAVPSAANLAAGELAINTTDEKIFFKNTGGTVVSISTAVSGGTVTSVAASGGTTGLTFSGSPITTSGTLTLGGTLIVANGGTGATTLTGYVKGNGTSAMTASSTIPGSDISGNISGNAANVTGTVVVANGGTGATTLTANYVLKGNGTSAVSASQIFDDGTNVGVNQASPASKLDLSGGFAGNVVTVSASAIDCSLGNYYIKTASGALTWTFTNVPASRAFSVLLELTNGGTGTQTWPASVKWPGGTAPTLTTSGVDLLGFITDDSGTTWRGVQLMKDSK